MKVIEAQQFLSSITTSTQLTPSAADAWCVAEVDEAVVAFRSGRRLARCPPRLGPTTFDRLLLCSNRRH